ncbi:MAG: transporter permease protein [Herbinix sp.]|jgi:putative ABC transport system permease protein|nr:transporter permease protein [Herbinix sp.]
MLFRKMLRDMRLNKTQFISIFLMAFLGVFIYAGVGGEWFGLQQTVNQYYEDTNLADIFLFGKDFSVENVTAVQLVEGVTGVQRRLTLESVGNFENNPDIILYFIEKNEISKCMIMEGEAFSNEKDGIWLDHLFADAKGLSVGDTISLTAYGMQIEKIILGTVLNPEYVYSPGGNDLIPNHDNFGFAYLPLSSFPSSMDLFYTDLLVTTDRKPDSALEDAIDQVLSGNYSVYLTRDNLESYAIFHSEIKQHKAMGAIFPVVFLAIAMLTILTTMTRMVTNQRTQIGTLMALGFQKKKILFHYLSYGFWLSLAGSLFGAVIGPLTLPNLFYSSMQTTYTLPEWKPAVSPSFFLMAFLSIAACTLVTYLSCKNILKDTPSQSLRPKSPKAAKHSAFEKTSLWIKLGFSIQWNLRDIFRSKIRSLMAIIGVLGCTALLVCAFGMQDSLDDVMTWQYTEINQFQTKVSLAEDVTSSQIEHIINDFHGEAFLEGAIEMKANGIKKTGELIVTDHVSLIHYTSPNRNFLTLPQDSISISYKMAKLLGVHKGDKISWHMYGDAKWVDSTIGEIYRSPVSQGISLSRELFESYGFIFHPTSIVTNQIVNLLPEGAISQWSTKDLSESYETMTEAMNVMVYVLILAAAILAMVVLYNLGILSFTERVREMATLKVLGLQSKKIRYLLLIQTIWLTFIGIILGIPCGKFLIDFMLAFMGDSFDMMCIINTSTILFSTAITFLLSITVNFMFSGKIKRIDMVSSLKGVE